MDKTAEKILHFLSKRREPVSAAMLADQFKLKTSEISTYLTKLRQALRVVKIGQTANARYLAVAHSKQSLPLTLYAVDSQGQLHVLAELLPVVNGGWVVQNPSDQQSLPAWLLGENGLGYYSDLPYFLDDLRPQGFLGRFEVRRLAQTHPVYPADPRHWQAQHILQYLLQENIDLPGNLLLGEQAKQTFLAQKIGSALEVSQFQEKVQAVLTGAAVGSSAGGEQPKLTAYTIRGHAIIKFSQTDSAAAQRWCDLLIAEHLALQQLAKLGLAVAETHLHLLEACCFLESHRFDRVAAHGRKPILSLAAVDAEFVGSGHDWLESAKELHRQALLSETDLEQVYLAYCFGRYIANDDMHLGNLSLIPHAKGFSLAPIYDMTPMRFKPINSQLLAADYQLPKLPKWDNANDIQAIARQAAQVFWQQIAEDERIMACFRQIASSAVKTLIDT